MFIKNKKLKIYLTFLFFVILNICSIKEFNEKIVKIRIGFPFEWFRLYNSGKFYINLFQLFLHILFCYFLTLVILKIIKKFN